MVADFVGNFDGELANTKAATTVRVGIEETEATVVVVQRIGSPGFKEEEKLSARFGGIVGAVSRGRLRGNRRGRSPRGLSWE